MCVVMSRSQSFLNVARRQAQLAQEMAARVEVEKQESLVLEASVSECLSVVQSASRSQRFLSSARKEAELAKEEADRVVAVCYSREVYSTEFV
jgi:hypothetical protein